jgi:hypothetical protein
MPPERLIQHYQGGGFDFLAIADHEKLTDRSGLSTPDFLVLRATEVQSGRSELGQLFHIVGVGVEGTIEREVARRLSAAEAIAELRRLGGEAIICHPYWSGLTAGDLLGLADYVAIEVYNTTCQVSIGRGHSEYCWDEVLTRGRPLRVVASDDCHRPGVDSRRAWTMIRAPELSEAAILEALRQGHFYASTGPEIRLAALRGDVVEVECSPVKVIEVVCDPTRGSRLEAGVGGDSYRALRKRPGHLPEGALDGELLTGASIELPRGARYARVQVTDAAGRMAWTNPLFID